MAALAPGAAYIFVLELVTAILAGAAQSFVSSGHWLLWEDNEPAKSAIIRGHTGDAAMNALIGAFWRVCSSRASAPWAERVCTDDNVADAVSRGDLALVESLGAQRLHLPPGFW